MSFMVFLGVWRLHQLCEVRQSRADLSIVLEYVSYLRSLRIFTNFEVPWYVSLAEGAIEVRRGGMVSKKLHRGGIALIVRSFNAMTKHDDTRDQGRHVISVEYGTVAGK